MVGQGRGTCLSAFPPTQTREVQSSGHPLDHPPAPPGFQKLVNLLEVGVGYAGSGMQR